MMIILHSDWVMNNLIPLNPCGCDYDVYFTLIPERPLHILNDSDRCYCAIIDYSWYDIAPRHIHRAHALIQHQINQRSTCTWFDEYAAASCLNLLFPTRYLLDIYQIDLFIVPFLALYILLNTRHKTNVYTISTWNNGNKLIVATTIEY